MPVPVCKGTPGPDLILLSQKVNFGEDVDMGQLQLYHGRHGLQGASYELCGVAHKLAVYGIHRRQVPAVPLQEVNKAAEDCDVGVQLYLSRAVKDEVVILTIRLHGDNTSHHI